MANEDLARTFHALGDKTRFSLYRKIEEKKQFCVGELAEEFNITSACVSQHMKILSNAGLIKRIREGQRVCYQINNDTQLTKSLSDLIFTK